MCTCMSLYESDGRYIFGVYGNMKLDIFGQAKNMGFFAKCFI